MNQVSQVETKLLHRPPTPCGRRGEGVQKKDGHSKDRMEVKESIAKGSNLGILTLFPEINLGILTLFQEINLGILTKQAIFAALFLDSIDSYYGI